MPSLFSCTTFALLSALAAVNAGPVEPQSSELVGRNVIGAIRSSADALEYKVQPVLDFDKDGCYNTAAIDSNGNINPGLNAGVGKCPATDCRSQDRLNNNNVYSRKRCNNGWCAIMYEYYFEKDQTVCGSFAGGHKHDWENIVVFTQGNSVKWVSPSCHGGYPNGSASPRMDGYHPKIVYHKDGGSTHCFRHANAADDSIENHTGRWFAGALIGWDYWPNTNLRSDMLKAWPGGVGPKLDSEFGDSLKAAAGSHAPGFNPYADS